MVDVAGARVVAVLTRAPSAGGKSRLFADLGLPPDRRLLEAFLLDTLDGVAASGVRRIVAVTPASACHEVLALMGGLTPALASVEVIAQSDGDLGVRMRTTMTSLFAGGALAVALTGSDLPHIRPALVDAAFRALDRDPHALVLGPAADGGYYLVASTRVADVFEGIEWGSRRVLEQTRQAAAARGVPVRLLKVLTDVDLTEDLRRAVHSAPASRTAAWLKMHNARADRRNPIPDP